MRVFAAVICFVLFATAASGSADYVRKTVNAETFVRTETFPRPPYSGATYFIYERGGKVICTKLKVCNKYDDCLVTYARGVLKDPEDVATGEPYGTTAPVAIPSAKQKKHACLVKFKLIKGANL